MGLVRRKPLVEREDPSLSAAEGWNRWRPPAPERDTQHGLTLAVEEAKRVQAGEPLVLICRVCGAPNALASRYCEVCRSTLEGARTATQADVGRRHAEHRRVQKRRRLLTFAGLLALLASLLASGYLRARFNAEVTLAPPASNLSSNSAPGEWTTKGHDESNSRYAPELPEFTGQLKWKLTTEEPFFSSPVATGDTVFSSTGDRRILALNALTGQIRWSVQVSGPVNSTPAVAGDVLVVALRGGLNPGPRRTYGRNTMGI